MHTARQLEAGQNVFSLAAEEPGFLYIPQVSGQWVHGFGPADINLMAGTSGVTFNAGLGGRAYLSDLFQLGLQTRYQFYTSEPGYFLSGRHFLQPRLSFSSSVNERRKFYGGTSINGLLDAPADEKGLEVSALFHSLTVGFENDVSDKLAIQVEATVPTAIWTPRRGLSSVVQSDALAWIGTQVGFGLNWF